MLAVRAKSLNIMANLNFIMPYPLNEEHCNRKDNNKVVHSWQPSGQSRAMINNNVAIECVCKHCGKREWTTVTRIEYVMLQDHWLDL